MKSFIQKNLPFLSILIIAALFLVPLIVANDFADLGGLDDFADMDGLDDFSDMDGLDDLPDDGGADASQGYSPEPDQTTGDADKDKDGDSGDGSNPFDGTMNPDDEPPFYGGDDDVPPLDELFEATIDISIQDNPDPVRPGNELVYTVTYYNRGYGDARDVVITDSKDSYTNVQSTEPSASTGDHTWNIGEVKSGEGGTITIKTTVKDSAEDGQTLRNTVSINYHDPVYGSKSTSETEETRVSTGTEPTPKPPADKDYIGIKILSTRFPVQTTGGEPLLMRLRIENDGTKRLEDVKIAVVSQDLGIRTSAGPFDLGRGDDVTKTLKLDIPYEAPEGNYFLRFTITSNGETRRVVYRDIDLVSTLE